MADHSSSFSSCFRPTTPKSHLSPNSGNPNLTTCLYHTHLGLTSLTWCRNILGRSLHMDVHFEEEEDEDGEEKETLSSSFHLHLKPLLFWRKHGVKRFDSKASHKALEIYWDLTKAKFHSNSEPQSGFYVCVVVNGEMVLVVGDLVEEAYQRTKTRKMEKSKSDEPQSLVLRREHVFGNKVYSTKARFGGKTREILIDCSVCEEPKLSISVEGTKVLEIKRLKWKFRGSERVEVDGIVVQVSWDVFNWLFEEDGHAVFMFRFEDVEVEEEVETELKQRNGEMNGFFGMNGFEKKKLRRSSLRSSSSSSISSGSSGSSSSIMEWASQEDNELQQSLSGFSLLVYAWKS